MKIAPVSRPMPSIPASAGVSGIAPVAPVEVINSEKPAGRGGFFDFLKKPFQALADSPNAQIALADIGASLDPRGVGGAVGGASKNLIKSKQAQNIFGQDESVEGVSDITPKHVKGDRERITTTKELPGGVIETTTKTITDTKDEAALTPMESRGDNEMRPFQMNLLESRKRI